MRILWYLECRLFIHDLVFSRFYSASLKQLKVLRWEI